MAGMAELGGLGPREWDELLQPYVAEPLSAAVRAGLERYLALLLRWNARMNLTAVREPRAMVQRHFGESLFAARVLEELHPAAGVSGDGQSSGLDVHPNVRLNVRLDVPRGTFLTLLDHGSGAGFPGVPMAIARPDLRVTLAEVQAKKASFLREVARDLGLSVAVHAARTEELPPALQFPIVTMRAVDHAAQAYPAAMARVAPGGHLLALEGSQPAANAVAPLRELPIPNSPGYLRIYPALPA